LFVTGVSGDTVGIFPGFASLPTIGATLAGGRAADKTVLSVTMTLTPLVAGAAQKVNHAFLCYSKWEEDGGQVIEADMAQALLDLGRWLPVALPGTIPGGDNIGGYHLACNPPPGAQPTGFYLGGGGDTLDWDSQFYYRIYH
jgi:hypothetical protein